MLLLSMMITGCAVSPVSKSSNLEIEGVLPSPSNSSWTLFRFGTLRYVRIPATVQAWTGPKELTETTRWLAIPSPEGVFRPVQALSATRGYFYLLDAASSRLCLYDTAVALISTFPLPERFTPFSPARAAVFRGADGTFLFADYAAGEAFIYADREGSESAGGARTWVLRGQTKMPVGWRDCYQQPGSEEISCRSGSGVMQFDGALNRIPAGGINRIPEGGVASIKRVRGSSEYSYSWSYPPSRLVWNPQAREWALVGLSQAGDTALFEFWPNRRALSSSTVER